MTAYERYDSQRITRLNGENRLSVVFNHLVYWLVDRNWEAPETRVEHAEVCGEHDRCELSRFEMIKFEDISEIKKAGKRKR